MGVFLDLIGTTWNSLQIGRRGAKISTNSNRGGLDIKDVAGSPAPVTISKPFITGDEIELNTSATENAGSWRMWFRRPSSGMAAHVAYTFPPTPGSPKQVLSTDGNGVMSWESISGTADKIGSHVSNLSFGSAATTPLFRIPANALIKKIQVFVDTAFSGNNPTLSIGTSSSASLFMGANQNDLKDNSGSSSSAAIYEVNPNIRPSAEAIDLIATYSGDGSTAGSARILIDYSIPSA